MAKKNSAATKRAALRSQPEEDPEFQIAPMIDILLVLLVFFMSISSTEILQTNDQVKLPIAKDANIKDKTVAVGQTIVNVLWSPINNVGTIDVDEKQYATADELTPLLAAKINANPAMRVLLRADKQVRYEFTKQLLKAIAAAGATNVTFSVVDKEGGGGGETAPPP